MDLAYIVTPLFTWFTAGGIKFSVNWLNNRRTAAAMIGYGGMPSNHSAIVSAMAVLIALREGITHPAFGVAFCLAFIVMLDARGLRRHVGLHAQAIRRLQAATAMESAILRERIGHTAWEILAGMATGALCAWTVWRFL